VTASPCEEHDVARRASSIIRRVRKLEPGMEPYPGYQLRRRLGRGGFADVWEASVAGRDVVALKFLPCANSRSTTFEVRSIQMVRALEHPNLVRIDRVWCLPGYIVIAMERADASLLDLLDIYETEFGTPVATEHTCHLLCQAAAALDFLNTPQHLVSGTRVGIQHRDVKPSNLLLFGDTVKVTDFGLATVLAGVTAPCEKAGTVEYSAPEVFQGRLSNRTDQYALALTYCHLRAGRMPFADSPSTFESPYVRTPPDLTILPPAERAVVARALAQSPEARWPTCVEFMDRLARVACRSAS
jgi:serine/threonine protein kinase